MNRVPQRCLRCPRLGATGLVVESSLALAHRACLPRESASRSSIPDRRIVFDAPPRDARECRFDLAFFRARLGGCSRLLDGAPPTNMTTPEHHARKRKRSENQKGRNGVGYDLVKSLNGI